MAKSLFNYTSEGLPLVSKDNINSLEEILIKSFEREKDFSKIITNISEENPFLLGYLHKFIEFNKPKELFKWQSFCSGGILTYELLRRQEESNSLTNYFSGNYQKDFNLPLVSISNIRNFYRKYSLDLDKMEAIFRERKIENPYLDNFIEKMSMTLEKLGKFFSKGHLVTYELLKREAKIRIGKV
jgi:hypothetical protein